MWIFYRNELANKITTIQDLSKYKVSLPPKKSGSYILTKKLFQTNGIDIDSNPNFVSSSWEDLRANILSDKADIYIFITTKIDRQIPQANKASIPWFLGGHSCNNSSL